MLNKVKDQSGGSPLLIRDKPLDASRTISLSDSGNYTVEGEPSRQVEANPRYQLSLHPGVHQSKQLLNMHVYLIELLFCVHGWFAAGVHPLQYFFRWNQFRFSSPLSQFQIYIIDLVCQI